MDEWNAVDLHMHTCVGVTGDGETDVIENFSYHNFINSLKEYKIRLAAITNHNIINLVYFLVCRRLAKMIDTNILFGVEIDTDKETGENYHFVAVFQEPLKKCFVLAKTINENTKSKKITGKVRYNSAEIIELIKNYNVIIIPHGDKSKGLLRRPNENELRDALKKVRDGFIRVFDSPSDWKLARIKSLLDSEEYADFDDDFGGVLFSDNRDWKNYGKNYRNFYMNAEPTFNGFLHAITNPTERFATKEFIPVKRSYISKIVIKKGSNDARIDDCVINLDSGYNCIIGKSGAGKSLLHFLILKSILKEDDRRLSALKGAYGFAGENTVVLYDEKNHEIQPDKINCGVGERIFDRIITASTTRDTNDMYKVIDILNKGFKPKEKFISFVEKYKTTLKDYLALKNKANSLHKSILSNLNSFVTSVKVLCALKDIPTFEFRIPKILELLYSDEDVKTIKTIEDSIKLIKNTLSRLKDSDRVELEKELSNFENLFSAKLKQIQSKNNEIKLDSLKKDVVSISLNGVNSTISENATKKSEITGSMNQTISDLTKDILKMYKVKIGIQRFDLSIDCGLIDRCGDLIPNSGITFSENIDKRLVCELDVKQNSIFATRGIQQYLNNKIYDMSDSKESKQVIDTYYEKGKLTETDINKVFQNVDLNVNVYFDKQNVKELNPGDISKKYIQTYFENELMNGKNTVILYDQIENDVDKPFINETLLKIISEMKRKAQLIIVTHDPIVAVNADPVNYIEAIKEDNGHIRYRSFRPESDKQDELLEIAKCVDGSKIVIKERYEIYRGDKTYAEN